MGSPFTLTSTDWLSTKNTFLILNKLKSHVQHLAGKVGCLLDNHALFFLLSEPISVFIWQGARLLRMISLAYTNQDFRISLEQWLVQGWTCDPIQSTKTSYWRILGKGFSLMKRSSRMRKAFCHTPFLPVWMWLGEDMILVVMPVIWGPC